MSPDKEFVWVIDPIDGTLAYLAGFPVFGTLVALLHGAAPVLGVIEMPMTEERWVGCRDTRTTRNGLPVKTRARGELSAALMSTSNPDFFGEADRPVLDRMRAATRWNLYGGSCLAYARIASGRIDIGLDASLDPTDYLALVPVIEGAGGVITDWRGQALGLASGDRIVAAGDRRVHQQALALLADG
jgi:histidinol phosphatase-like enzyme (inositol monophosphatase family)